LVLVSKAACAVQRKERKTSVIHLLVCCMMVNERYRYQEGKWMIDLNRGFDRIRLRDPPL
jgi:hypothetical protein